MSVIGRTFGHMSWWAFLVFWGQYISFRFVRAVRSTVDENRLHRIQFGFSQLKTEQSTGFSVNLASVSVYSVSVFGPRFSSLLGPVHIISVCTGSSVYSGRKPTSPNSIRFLTTQDRTEHWIFGQFGFGLSLFGVGFRSSVYLPTPRPRCKAWNFSHAISVSKIGAVLSSTRQSSVLVNHLAGQSWISCGLCDNWSANGCLKRSRSHQIRGDRWCWWSC
jgi:hypothetical protein